MPAEANISIDSPLGERTDGSLLTSIQRIFLPPNRFTPINEAAFRVEYAHKYALHRRVAIILAVVMWASFYQWDFYNAAQIPGFAAVLYKMLLIRSIGLIVLLAATGYLMTSNIYVETRVTFIVMLAAVVAFLDTSMQTILTPFPFNYVFYYVGLYLIMSFTVCLLRLLSRPTLYLYAFFVMMGGVIEPFSTWSGTGSSGHPYSGYYVFSAINYLMAFAIIGVIVAIELERTARSAFSRQRALYIANTELAYERAALARKLQADGGYLEWLRRLATFLRHEVRNPIARINSSIELIARASGQDEDLLPHIQNAALGTQDVWTLLERASRATDAEAFVRQGQPQQLNLTALVAQLVENFDHTHSGVSFQFNKHRNIEIVADPTLIREACSNLLENAASFATEYSTIIISITHTKTACIITITNNGPLIEGDTEDLFGAFTSTRSFTGSPHHGLGLYLVRLVAESCGGTARIRNLEDGSGVEASMELPVTR